MTFAASEWTVEIAEPKVVYMGKGFYKWWVRRNAKVRGKKRHKRNQLRIAAIPLPKMSYTVTRIEKS